MAEGARGVPKGGTVAVLHQRSTDPPAAEPRREPHPESSPPPQANRPPATGPLHPPTTHPNHSPPAVPHQSPTPHPHQPPAALPSGHPIAHPAQPPEARAQHPRTARPEQSPKRVLGAALGVLLAGAFLVLGYQVRPAPYGDHLTPGPPAHTARARGGVVEAYDGRGVLRWRYARAGRRPVGVLPTRGETITLWDDGLVTDTDGRSVRWHRALPAATAWLRARGGAGVLRPLGRGILAVVTPARIAAYRTADGDLRWVLPARPGCAFRPERAVRHGAVLLVAQPCAHGAWTAQLVAVDDLGGVAPHRTPLGNDRPRAGRPEHPRTEKALASPR
ncbi:hypothetical protein ACIRQQ_18320 [Streptomyces fuscichromogenes]|uniref:hypothetical protein n=1 Tax=Streptomyces fuscichromogenes TaxID=1324013 RepID=UPI0037F83A6E